MNDRFVVDSSPDFLSVSRKDGSLLGFVSLPPAHDSRRNGWIVAEFSIKQECRPDELDEVKRILLDFVGNAMMIPQ